MSSDFHPTLESLRFEPWRFAELSSPEHMKACLNLRFEILCEEFGYCHDWVSQPGHMADLYDHSAVQIGAFLSGQLVAATRLVHAPGARNLPSYSLLPGPVQAQLAGSFGEVSRVVVAEAHRHKGLFGVLLVACFLIARQLRLEGLLISERSKPAFSRQLHRFGFRACHRDYLFHDLRLSPPPRTTTYVAKPLRHEGFYRELLPAGSGILERGRRVG